MLFAKNKRFLSNKSYKQNKFLASSFHTSCVMEKKISDRRMKVIMQDPQYQGQQKLQAMQEKALKEGLPVTPTRRVALLSGQNVLDFTLPYARKYNPPFFSKLYWKYFMYKAASTFKSRVYYRIKLINYLSKNKRKRLSMNEMKKTCLDLYLKFNVDRAKHDYSNMENYVSSAYLMKIQAENATKKPKPNIQFKWECDPSIKAKRVSLRMIETAPLSTEIFLQVVYKITSTQKVTAYNKTTGEEVGGTPYETVTDYFGFEKELTNSATSPWMVLEQLFEPEEDLTEDKFKSIVNLSMGPQSAVKE